MNGISAVITNSGITNSEIQSSSTLSFLSIISNKRSPQSNSVILTLTSQTTQFLNQIFVFLGAGFL